MQIKNCIPVIVVTMSIQSLVHDPLTTGNLVTFLHVLPDVAFLGNLEELFSQYAFSNCALLSFLNRVMNFSRDV